MKFQAALKDLGIYRQCFITYARANAGRVEPDANDASPTAREMRRRDVQSANSIEAMSEAVDRLRSTQAGIQALGNRTVASEIGLFIKLECSYWTAASVDGYYKAARAMAFLDECERVQREMADLVRAELAVDSDDSPPPRAE